MVPFGVVILFILLFLIPAYYLNKWLIKVLKPRKNFGLFLLYILLCLTLVFAYTFLLSFIILKVLPVGKR
jgi:Kef-type K+ transport system membrane component KefB